MIEVVVADRRSLYTDLMAGVLTRHGYRVADTSTTAERTVDAVATGRPDLCLIDHLSLAGPDASTLLRDVLAAGAGHTDVVVVTGHADRGAPAEALALGVRGYVQKACSMSTLLDALVRVEGGDLVVETLRDDVHPRSGTEDDVHRLAAFLTPREWECLALVVRGASTESMARALNISVMTVRSHVRSLLGKLAVHSRLEAASLAMRHDLVGPRLASRAG